MSITEVCPIMRASLQCHLVDTGEFPVSFVLSNYPDWKATYLAKPEQISQFLSDEEHDVWQSKGIMELLNRVPQGIENAILFLTNDLGAEIKLTVQPLTFQPGRQIRQDVESLNGEKEKGQFRRRISKLLSFKVLTLGQFMVSGNYGCSANQEAQEMSEHEYADLITAAGTDLAKKLGGFSAVLLKDLSALANTTAEYWKEQGFYHLPVDPSMGLEIRPDWRSFEDYLLDMTSKYRVRYRRTRKKLPGHINQRSLSLKDCEQYASQLHQLYNNVRSEAAFDAVSLDPCYFVSLKETLGNDLKISAYFDGEQLIGFRTAIMNGDTLHAHYLGFDQQLNRAYHLYHNMLFDFVQESIQEGFKYLDFGRTALEIKSSVGAVPTDYFCGIRAVNPLMRWLVPVFTPALFTPTQWTQRNPFK